MPSAALRAVLIAIVAVACAVLGLVQFSSSALASRELPHRGMNPIPLALARKIDRALFAVSSASFLAEDLARDAFVSGRWAESERIALHMGSTGARNELLMRIAQVKGNAVLAEEYALAAPDPDAIARYATSMERTNPLRAYDYLGAAVARFRTLGSHPDALAFQVWKRGQVAARISYQHSPQQRFWGQRALTCYATAAQLAPYSQTYLLAAGTQAWLLNHPKMAQRYFERVVANNPRSVDALAGLGVVAVALGQRARARIYLRRARTIDPKASFVRTLEHLVENSH